ncbi:hypothetical protein [Streptomyces sp. NPDC005732]|uniref:DUF6907 domain-containing protein n=1 Tax=Streptomyces sp. NPDC005732 TaxID=3157057 RepID=UPI0033C9097F
MQHLAISLPFASTLTEQSVSTTFHVEVMNDLETGQPTLVASTYPNQGDLQVVTMEQVGGKASEAHAVIAQGVALAAAYEAATAAPAEAPPTQTAIDLETGDALLFTCMTGCNYPHASDEGTPGFADEVTCVNYDRKNQGVLPIGCGDDSTPGPVLSTLIQVDHFHPDPARRAPYAAVEVFEDHFLEYLDPDALAAVIDHFEERVAAMRVRHAELVRARAEYLGRQA